MHELEARDHSHKSSAISPLALWCLLAYAVCLVLLLKAVPLWLDELIDLSQVISHDFGGLIAYIPRNPGGVPVGYLSLAAMVKMFGTSPLFVRLPSAVAAVGSAAGVYMIARAIRLRFPLLAATLFSLLPLQLRYALEARPYALALCLSIWLTVILLSVLRRFSWLKLGGYAACLGLALYTQPFASFIVCGHLGFALFLDKGRYRLSVPAILAAVCAGFAMFLPWYFYAHTLWSSENALQHPNSHIGTGALLLIIRELTGAGYVGMAMLLGTAAYGWRKACPLYPGRLFWTLTFILPLVLALLVDFTFQYFLAIRQMIFVLPALAIVAAHGLECLYRSNRRAATSLGVILAVVLLYANMRFFLRPHENWQAAAELLRQGSTHACTVFIPEESIALYRVVDASLQENRCPTDSLLPGKTVMLAVSPYAAAELHQQQEQRLRAMKLRKVKEENVAGPRVETFIPME